MRGIFVIFFCCMQIKSLSIDKLRFYNILWIWRKLVSLCAFQFRFIQRKFVNEFLKLLYTSKKKPKLYSNDFEKRNDQSKKYILFFFYKNVLVWRGLTESLSASEGILKMSFFGIFINIEINTYLTYTTVSDKRKHKNTLLTYSVVVFNNEINKIKICFNYRYVSIIKIKKVKTLLFGNQINLSSHRRLCSLKIIIW